MLRAVACCQQLHTALGEKLKASTHFAREDWVILGEIDEPGFNGRVGQIIQLRPGDRTRYAVQVDGLTSSWPGNWEERSLREGVFIDFDRCLEEGGLPVPWLPLDIGSRPVSLLRFNLQKIPATVSGVRLYTNGEMMQGLIDSVTFPKPFAASAARIPPQLAIFAIPDGQSPSMKALGRPVVLRQVISANDPKYFSLADDWECHASSVLRLRTHRYHREACGDLLVLTSGPGLPTGPTIIAWQDQSDFTLDDMKQVWEFHHAALTMAVFEKDTLVRLWKEAAEVNNISTQEVVHQEPPAQISPDEAQKFVEAQLASTIRSEPMPSTMGELACVVTFHRTPASLDRAVSQSDSGRRLLEKGVNLKPCWANGAKILVEGLTEEIWKQACQDAGENPELRPAHVVLPSSALSEILTEVQKIPHSSRPRIKAGQATISVPDLSQFTDLSDTGARGSQESSYAFIPANSSAVSSEMSGWAAFIDGLREKIMHVPLGPLNVTRGFIHDPEEAPITPRSEATESEHGNLGINPRLFQ